MQELLDKQPELFNIILDIIVANGPSVIFDVYGNSIFAFLFQAGSLEDRVRLTKAISGHIVEGLRELVTSKLLQNMIEVSRNEPEVATLIAESIPTSQIRHLSIDKHANHGIQFILNHFPIESSRRFAQEIIQNVSFICNERYGCYVAQRAFDVALNNNDHSLQRQMIMIMLRYVEEIFTNNFGNYFAQYVLKKCSSSLCCLLSRALIGKVEQLAMHKYASNIIEVCLDKYDAVALRQVLYYELSKPATTSKLIKDKFGIFVLLKSIHIFHDDHHTGVIDNVLRQYTLAKSTGKGMKVLQAIRDVRPDLYRRAEDKSNNSALGGSRY